MDGNPGMLAPINPLHVYSNVTKIMLLQITVFFWHQLVAIGASILDFVPDAADGCPWYASVHYLLVVA